MTVRITHHNGFTLIELVIIIVVLGIIAAVAVPRMGAVTENSKHTATKSEMQMMKRAIIGNPQAVAGGRYINLGFEGDVGHPPASLFELGAKPDSIAAYNKFTRRGWNGPYVDTAGGDYLTDAYGANYVYDRSGRRLISIGGTDSIIVTF